MEYVENRQPIRPGFKVGTWDVGKVLPRYEGYVSWSEELKPDGISIGISLEKSIQDNIKYSNINYSNFLNRKFYDVIEIN